MSLIGRLAGIPGPGQDKSTVKKIGFAQFTSALRETHRGNLSKEGIITAFDLNFAEGKEIDLFYLKLVGKGNDQDRENFLIEAQQVFHLCELGVDDTSNGGIDYTDLAQVTTRLQAI